MLRSQANRLHRIEPLVGSLKSGEVEFGFESKVVHAGRTLQQFEFDIAAECSEEVVGLCDDSLRG